MKAHIHHVPMNSARWCRRYMEDVARVLQTFHFAEMPHYIALVVAKLRKVLTAVRSKLNEDGLRAVFNAEWSARGQAVCALTQSAEQFKPFESFTLLRLLQTP
jgi:hypothetical protein